MVQEATQPQSDAAIQPIGSVATLATHLEKWMPNAEKLAEGTQLVLPRFRAVVLAAFSRTPKLLECTAYSIKRAVFAAAELGLEIGGVSGEAYLVPYRTRKKMPGGKDVWFDEAQCIVGYKGYLRLAWETGLFRDLNADVILPDDVWEPVRRGPDRLQWGHIQGEPQGEPPMMQIPALKGWGDKKTEYMASVPALRGAYAYAKLKDEGADDIVRAIWLPRLEEIRTRGKAGFDGPWITDYHEMAKKTAFRNLWKYLPKNDRMRRAEELDDDGLEESPLPPQVVAAAPPPAQLATNHAKAKTDRVAAAVAAKAREVTPEPPKAQPPPKPADDEDAAFYAAMENEGGDR